MPDGLSAEIIISWMDSFILKRAKSTSYILAHLHSASLGSYRNNLLIIQGIQHNFDQGFVEWRTMCPAYTLKFKLLGFKNL